MADQQAMQDYVRARMAGTQGPPQPAPDPMQSYVVAQGALGSRVPADTMMDSPQFTQEPGVAPIAAPPSDKYQAEAAAGAIRYALTRWNALLRYLADGRLEMSNNAAERGMRAPVLGRKNYLFCGSDAGGQRAACVYTIVESAKMCGINPQAYLADVLERIADHPIHKIDALLPWLWTQ